MNDLWPHVRRGLTARPETGRALRAVLLGITVDTMDAGQIGTMR